MTPSFEQLGKLILGFALILGIVGGVLILLGKAGVPRLPGDILFKRDHTTVYIPLATMILVSVILTVVLNVLFWLFRR
ncbi:MAG: DUF2905 domain-containing protein [Actinobacteria bacterium]|nr:DUF2905 domain-containing protein [Actinomycetota bacterium]